jgi:hypothetical protein
MPHMPTDIKVDWLEVIDINNTTKSMAVGPEMIALILSSIGAMGGVFASIVFCLSLAHAHNMIISFFVPVNKDQEHSKNQFIICIG